METITTIQENETYKQIMADSFGGIMYDVANGGKYDSTEIMSLWDSMTPAEQEAAGGIVRGAIDFLKEYN